MSVSPLQRQSDLLLCARGPGFGDDSSAVLPAPSDLACRRPVWLALSDLFLDTDVQLLQAHNTRLLAGSAYSLDELDAILRDEVHPACAFNLCVVAGEWAGFEADWLERRILRGGPPPRSRWRRWWRALTLGSLVPVPLPAEWSDWRAEVARLRAEAVDAA